MNQIAYKFVSWDVPALESLAGSKAYILRKRLNDGGTLTREEKDWITREVNHNTYFKVAEGFRVSPPHVCTTASEVVTVVACDDVPAEQEQKTLTGLPAATAQTNYDFTLSTAITVAERVRGFDLASSTPMECMLFISDLKKSLSTLDDRGSIR